MEKVFLEHLERIERVAASMPRRGGFPPQDVEDFVSVVKVKLIENDYLVLRRYKGDGSLGTYLSGVIGYLYRDFCNEKLGRFRPSAKAKRLGPTALALERLLNRDQHDLESAIEILKNHHNVTASRNELRDLAGKLRRRAPPRLVSEKALTHHPAPPETTAEQRVVASERLAFVKRLEAALNETIATLSPQNRLILKMHLRDGCTIATIAAVLNLEQRPLYRRRNRILRQLRASLDAEGLTWAEVEEILDSQDLEIHIDFARSHGKNDD